MNNFPMLKYPSRGLWMAGFFFACTAASMASFAQNNAMPKVKNHTCERPVVKGKIQTDEAFADFTKRVGEYKTCMLAYMDEQKKLAEPYDLAAQKAKQEFAAYIKSSPAVEEALA